MQNLKKIFISHASEDKDSFARPLANLLVESGYKVWFDEFSLSLGDSLKSKIDEGLSLADYGIVILSPSFFSKQWTRDELDGVIALEHSRKEKVLLPIWHEINFDEVAKFSPTLAGKLAVSSSEGMSKVLDSIVKVTNEVQTFKAKKKFDKTTIYIPRRNKNIIKPASFTGTYRQLNNQNILDLMKQEDISWKEFGEQLITELERLDEKEKS